MAIRKRRTLSSLWRRKKRMEKDRMKTLKNMLRPNGLANAYRKRAFLKDYE